MTNDNDTTTMTRKPPLWLKREPLTRAQVIERLDAWAAGNIKLADASRDPDIAAGLHAQAQTQARTAIFLRNTEGGQRVVPAAVFEHLRQLRDARRGCAYGTTEPMARGTYVDAWWTYVEALRYLGD